ncbi:hypothetical protein FM119_03525 [Mycetocola reblochoni REB411]|uniref:Uncharacterized protein n=1 Tax=Mycetocola reblochoni REB411 TaxID=1255698 RepID=A0A1R4IU12_9MICO|nr:hypothetical protein FM119_03525 [Mycetocola reblochoni REB411]
MSGEVLFVIFWRKHFSVVSPRDADVNSSDRSEDSTRNGAGR